MLIRFTAIQEDDRTDKKVRTTNMINNTRGCFEYYVCVITLIVASSIVIKPQAFSMYRTTKTVTTNTFVAIKAYT
jgi:hypothetical protein